MSTTTSASHAWVSTKATTRLYRCRITFTREGEDGDLNVGCSLIYADVEHGSKMTKEYGWNVSYTVSLDGNQVDSGVLMSPRHRHALLLGSIGHHGRFGLYVHHHGTRTVHH